MKEVRTKQGAAAIYTVVFFCLLVGIVTISFVSVMIQDILSSSNYDLSQSAYDAALAGVEDAKVVLLKYNQECVNSSCPADSNLRKLETSSSDCDIINKALKTNAAGGDDVDGRAQSDDEDNPETLIQTRTQGRSVSGDSMVDDTLDMAYTCVQISLPTSDYLGKFSSSSDIKIIPLRSQQDPSTIKKVRVSWFNNSNVRSVRSKNYGADWLLIPSVSQKYTFNSVPTAPPVVKFSLIQTESEYTFATLNQNNNYNATVFLRPTKEGGVTSISKADLAKSTNSHNKNFDSHDASGYLNTAQDVSCTEVENNPSQVIDQPYLCQVDIELLTLSSYNRNTRLIALSTPYATIETDFKVEMLDGDNKVIDFFNVQPSVDATGRANDVFRRIESRIEMIDTTFPYPRYALNSYGNGDDEGEIFKSYWATQNCWAMHDGTASTCKNYSPMR